MVQKPDQIVDAGDAVAVDPHNGVEAHQPCPRRRTVRLQRRNHRTRRIVDTGIERVPARHRRGLTGHADIAAPHAAVLDQFAQHKLRGIGGDRETYPLRAANDGGVDADHFATRRHQRSAGIAGIERRVGLDHILNQPAVARPQ